MGPINYSAMQIQADPYGAYTKAKQAKTAEQMAMRRLDNDEKRYEAEEAQRAREEKELSERKRLAQEQRDDMIAFARKPNQTPQDFMELIAKHPKAAKEMRASYDEANEQGRKQMATEASQIYAALNSGNPEIALDLIQGRAEAYKAAGDDKGYAGTQAMKEIIKQDPNAARVSAGLYLASVTDGNKLAYTMNALENVKPGNTAGDIASLADYGADLNLERAQINKVMARTRGQSADERKAALEKEAGVDVSKAEKHRRGFDADADKMSWKNKAASPQSSATPPAAA